MNCEDILELINPYIDGELDTAGSENVETHLQSCDSCRSQVEALRSTITAIRTLDELDVPANVSSALRNIAGSEDPGSVDPVHAQRVRFIPHFFRYASAVGAVAAIIIVVFAAQNYRNTGQFFAPEKLEQQDLQGIEESTRMAPNLPQNTDKELLAGKNEARSAKTAPDQAVSEAQDARESQETGAVPDGVTPALTGAIPGTADSKTLHSESKESTKNKGLSDDASVQTQTFGASEALSMAPQNTDWPQVTLTTTNYDRTAADVLLGRISKDTKGLYTVGSAMQVKDWAIDAIVDQIDTNGGNGESMRKPINALLDETKRDAVPVYMEKAKYKGADCWLIVIRWGFGEDRNPLSKTSLYITDPTGWKTLYYSSL